MVVVTNRTNQRRIPGEAEAKSRILSYRKHRLDTQRLLTKTKLYILPAIALNFVHEMLILNINNFFW